jgi:hypothetical protein
MRKLIIVCLGFILFLCSCKNDLVLNAEWKDITVIYGLLNQKDSIQYLKINKAYLGEGNALYMAQIPDSSTYYNNLDVKIEEWQDDQYNGKTLVFDTATVYNKEPGTLYFPNQIIYKSSVKLDSLNDNIDYRLIITNKITGKIITGKTKLIKSFHVNKPYRNPINPIVNFTGIEPYDVEFTPPKNGRFFQVYFRLNYTELDTISKITTNKSIDYFVGETVYDDIATKIIVSFLGESFYGMLKSKIGYNPNMIRKVSQGEEIELIINVANDDFYTYMQAVKPSNGLVQEKPEFTNIDNGIGIFGSRYYLKTTYNLSNASLDTLCYGRLTGNLGFQK